VSSGAAERQTVRRSLAGEFADLRRHERGKDGSTESVITSEFL
jgi:hypothetical protein